MRQSFSKLTIQKRYVFLFLPSQIHESTGYPKLHVQEIIAKTEPVQRKPPTALLKWRKRKRGPIRIVSGMEKTETVNYPTGTRQSWKPVGHTSSPNQLCEKHHGNEWTVKQKKKKKKRRGGHGSIKTGFRRKSNYSACFHGGGPWRNDWPTGWLITRNRRTIVERWRFISVPIWRVSKPVYDIGVSFFFFFFDTHLPATINIPFSQTKGYRGLVRFQKSNLFTESARSVSHKMVTISDEYDDA